MKQILFPRTMGTIIRVADFGKVAEPLQLLRSKRKITFVHCQRFTVGNTNFSETPNQTCLHLYNLCKETLFMDKVMEFSSVNENEVKEVQHFADPEKQEARAFLRERFLRAMSGIVGKKCDFHMFEKTNVSAEFRGCDVDVLNFFVTNLQTPVSVKRSALIRAGDILTIHVPDIGNLPK